MRLFSSEYESAIIESRRYADSATVNGTESEISVVRTNFRLVHWVQFRRNAASMYASIPTQSLCVQYQGKVNNLALGDNYPEKKYWASNCGDGNGKPLYYLS